jgi:hypothetical protein
VDAAALLTANGSVSEKIAANLVKSENITGNPVTVALSAFAGGMKTQLVHKKWPLLIAALQSRGIKTMLLTSCGAEKQGVAGEAENMRKNHLLNVGVDFQKSWQDIKRLELRDIPKENYLWNGSYCCAFVDGMLFADWLDKGVVLKVFLSKIPQYKFRKIIFIDDRLKNLKAVEKICTEMGIQFVGVEYIYTKTRKHPFLNPEMENNAKNSREKIMEIIDFGVVRSCSGHRPRKNRVFAAVRKSVSEKDISNDVLLEYIDDFFEIRHKIYNMVGFACQLEFARKAYAGKIGINIVLDCVNGNLFGSNAITKISENIVKNADFSIDEEILDAGCGSPWKDRAKYNFVRRKLFWEKKPDIWRKQAPSERYENYQRIIAKVYDFGCNSHALNCKYHIARNFIKRGVDKKFVCKIFGFTDGEFENFVQPVN